MFGRVLKFFQTDVENTSSADVEKNERIAALRFACRDDAAQSKLLEASLAKNIKPLQQEAFLNAVKKCELTPQFFKSLILNSPDVNYKYRTDTAFMAALMYAAGYGHTKIVKFLLAVPEINVNLEDDMSDTALLWAARNGRTEIVKLFLDVPGIEIDLGLMFGDYGSHTEIVKLLLDRPGVGVDVAFQMAVLYGHTETIKLVAAKVLCPNADKVRGNPPHDAESFALTVQCTPVLQEQADIILEKVPGFDDFKPFCRDIWKRIKEKLTEKLPLEIAKLYLQMVLVSDGYDTVKEQKANNTENVNPEELAEQEVFNQTVRFCKITQRLPPDHQMVLANRAFGSMENFVLSHNIGRVIQSYLKFRAA